ncbi:hypothetical protein [Phenylobacterium sp.]|jgi:hypothetical protein
MTEPDSQEAAQAAAKTEARNKLIGRLMIVALGLLLAAYFVPSFF